MMIPLQDISQLLTEDKRQTFSEFRRDIGVGITIPQITLSHLNSIDKTSNEYKNNIPYKLRTTPAALHYVTYHGREIPIIVFSYGFIYLGKDDSFLIKNDEWKVIWFENITEATSENNKYVKLIGKNSGKAFLFEPCKGHDFNDFMSTLEVAFTLYSKVRFIPNKRIIDSYLSNYSKKYGGRRKTKRSKSSKHTRRNKKCKRRTRRS